MDAMDADQTQRIRSTLLSKRERILEAIERAQAVRSLQSAEDHNSSVAEIVDMAQSLEQMDRDESLADQERRELGAIERALAKMATGSFGICEDCEEEIPVRRLLVLPEARLCARCQASEERTLGRIRGIPLMRTG